MPNRKTGKIRVGVLFGGRSGEHEVSLRSARSVMHSLDPAKYEVVPVGITKDGRWMAGDRDAEAPGSLKDGAPGRVVTLLPEPTEQGLMAVDPPSGDLTSSSLSIMAELDVVFPVLHGPYGEDGTVQGLLELAGLPYVGAGVTGSAVGMDKGIFKHVMAATGLPVLPWVLCTRRQWLREPDAVIKIVEETLPFPVFTKPANLGSSVGIRKCRNSRELREGLTEAARFDRRLVIEKGIDRARELEVSVLGNEDPVASVVGEIRPRRDFYDYVAKYMTEPGSEEESELIIPASVSPDLSRHIRELAIRAYKAIDCAGLARVDLLLDDLHEVVYLNEINTLPGFTDISMYPKLWEATGISYSELLDRLIDLALERYSEKAELVTSIDVTSLQSGEETRA